MQGLGFGAVEGTAGDAWRMQDYATLAVWVDQRVARHAAAPTASPWDAQPTAPIATTSRHNKKAGMSRLIQASVVGAVGFEPTTPAV